jgi:hypothetical protein
MLADKYLQDHHFRIFHSIEINNKSDDVYFKLLHAKPDHWLVRILFRLRGIRSRDSINQLSAHGFILLEEIKGEEIAYGIVSSSPYFGRCIENFTAPDFHSKFKQDFLRGIIVFGVTTDGATQKIFTETRVHCGSKKIYNRFRVYWFFVNPFSSLIRRIMLKQIRNNIKD